MKKNLLLAGALALFFSTASAQSSRLAAINTSDDFTQETFSYDEQGRFSRFTHTDLDPYLYYDEYVYDEKNQLVEDYTYQDINDTGNYTLVSKCCYGYDEQGRLSWRDNYNSFGGELSQSAHIVYEYDGQGHLVKESQYWSFDLENPFMVVDYEYNELGQLVSAVDNMADFWDPSVFEEIDQITYDYDEAGNRIRENRHSMTGGEEVLTTYEEYDYDGFGNIVEARYCTASGTVHDKSVFTYDTGVDASDVLYPASVEYNIGYTFGLKSMRTAQDIYLNDNTTDEVFYAYTKEFAYEDSGTTKVSNVAGSPAFVDVKGKVLNLGTDASCAVNVYGVNGRLAMSVNARGTADLSALAPGVYVATVKGAGMAPSYHKFVIK